MRPLTEFKVLTFDCYGTMIDWERGILTELRPFLVRHGRSNVDEEALLRDFGAEETACQAATPSALYPDILAEVHRRLTARLDIPPDPVAAEAFGRSVGDWPPFADSPASLQYLKRYYKLVVLSNVDRASFARSNKALGVEFDHVITAQDVGSYKPDPRNFRVLLEDVGRLLGAAKGDILHTAQSLYHDIVPARSAGLATMWVNRRQGKGGWGATPEPADWQAAQPDYEVACLSDLVALHQAHLRGETQGR